MTHRHKPDSSPEPRNVPTGGTHPRRPLPEADAEHAALHDRPRPPRPTGNGLAGALLAIEATRRLSGPPRRAFRTNEGRTVHEDLVLVGWVEAPMSARKTLDLYGIDMSYAHYDPAQGRWEDCFFSEEVADMLVELTEEDQFPHPFEASPSWATLDWWVRKSQGERVRPEYEVYLYCEPASPESVRAWERKTGRSVVRRGRGRLAASGGIPGGR